MSELSARGSLQLVLAPHAALARTELCSVGEVARQQVFGEIPPEMEQQQEPGIGACSPQTVSGCL